MRKVTALLLTAALALSMTACASEAPSQTSSDPSASSGDGTINLTTVKIIDSTMTFVDGSADDNVFQDDVLRDLNIDITYEWIADVSQSESKFATMVASGTVPDYFNVADANLAFQLINDGYCMDITDIYEQYASDDLKARDAAFPEAHDSLKKDGRLYGISELGYGVGNELNIIWVRKDWLEKSGQGTPKTMDELFELAEWFKGNIDGCEYGISLQKDIGNLTEHNVLPLMNAYGAYSKIWMKDDTEKIVYSSVQPEMKDALTALQDLYSRGIISQEFSVKDAEAVSEDVAASKVGVVCGVNWIGWSSLGRTVSLDPNATWLPISVPTLNEGDDMVKLQSGWPVGGYWLISKDCQNPEAVIELFNYFVENENQGKYNADAYNNAGGVFGGSPVYQTNPAHDYLAIGRALASKDDSQLSGAEKTDYNNARLYLEDGETALYGSAAQCGPEGIGAYNEIYKYVDSGNYVLTEMRGAMPEGYAQSYGTLSALEDEYFTRIIMGESIDLFDEFVEKWYSSGGQSATDEMNEMYGA